MISPDPPSEVTALAGDLAAELDLEAGVAGGCDGTLERVEVAVRSGSVTGTS